MRADFFSTCPSCTYVPCAEDLLELHRGQGKDIYWRDTNTCPTEDEYLEMVEQSMHREGAVARVLNELS